MALTPNHSEQEALADTFRRDGAPMSERQALAAIAPGVLFVAVEASLLVRGATAPLHPIPILACLLVLLIAARVRIHLPFGFTVPTQLGFVPLLFAAPPALVPVLVLLVLAVATLFDVARGEISPARLVTVFANSAFSLGPAAVFVAAGVGPQRAGVALLLTALLAQFAIDFTISTLRQRIDREVSFSSQLGETWVYAVDAGLACVAFVVAKSFQHSTLAVFSLVPLVLIFAVFATERRARLESLLELRDAYRGTALALRDVVEADDRYTGWHCEHVVTLALAVGSEMSLDAQRMRNLEFGALLHDVGKVAIPKEIINKPGTLDPHEWDLIRTHTIEGQKMLNHVGGFMREVGAIVRSHHERWDGSGYPDGLAGPQIPLEARIISCCDTWNAMRTDRAYRKALSHEAAMAELRAASGSQLDPAIVAVLIPMLAGEGERPGLETQPWLDTSVAPTAVTA